MMKGTIANNVSLNTMTVEHLQKIVDIVSYKYKEPEIPKYKPSLIEKIMNKFGWYKKREYYFIDREKMFNEIIFKDIGFKI